MKPYLFLISCFLISTTIFGQSIDDSFSAKKMKKDLEIFKNIRLEANSGLYKYRSKKEIDSIYEWAFMETEKSKTHRDFYNIICYLTDFEGSTHNSTSFSEKMKQSIKKEEKGYFPFPIKCIEGKIIVNIENENIPLGAEIISIDNHSIKDIISNLYKYYTTDGANISGKFIGINYNFSKYYRQHYGLKDTFEVVYKPHGAENIKKANIQSVGNEDYYKNVKKRHSKPFDDINYKNWNEIKKYNYQNIDSETSILTLNSFVIGDNATSPEHLKFVRFLDSTFASIKAQNIKNLIVDIRYNGGGTDPNDLVVYEYLTQRNFSENKSAWISFKKIPYLKYIETNVPVFLRSFGVIKHNNYFKKEFPLEKNGKFYQDETSEDHTIRVPNKNAFEGNIYLLISPRVASAASNFGSLVASNKNTTIIGEETMGGFYGHNGHTPLSYILPKSKIVVEFSVVNLEQDVLEKQNQIQNRGIIPDYAISQTYEDYLTQTDTQMNFVLHLLKNQK